MIWVPASLILSISAALIAAFVAQNIKAGVSTLPFGVLIVPTLAEPDCLILLNENSSFIYLPESSVMMFSTFSGKIARINSNTPEVKEVIGFNPTNVELIEGNGVAYGLSYQDNGNGSSKVKLLISPLYQSKTYECGTNISVANEFKDQLSLTLIEDSAEIDKVGIIFPEEGISEEGEKYVKGLSFHTYGIKQSINVPSVEHLDKRKLQKNINNGSPANVGNSYFQPRAAKVDNGDVIIIAHNLKDQTLVSWYLKLGKSGKFKVLDGKQGFTERKLFKFGNPGQLVLNGNTMLYSQVSKRITKENQEVRKTRIFKFDMAKVIQGLKDGVNRPLSKLI
ncbi:uncharacterized protein TNCT_142661 [Trichonephila clavata]|uniref:Uncharacterized protein n=1 Tax=Trichonephila clavata TaxID=2740835 RepID=A0A8X6LWQ9_TRICU|nr:uncharacterized protein TNCT_142661 [Trichonephila clavata]